MKERSFNSIDEVDLRQEITDKPATLNDVALFAGVGTAAVSGVLNNNRNGTRVSAATRKRIEEAIIALDYRPNQVARSLRQKVTNIIGFYCGEWSRHIRKPFFTEIISGLEQGCATHQKDLLIHASFHGRSSESIFNELRGGQIGGLILFTPEADDLRQRLVNSRLPVVAIANPVASMRSVVVNDAFGSRLLVRHLAERGHHRVLYLRNRRGLTLAERRFYAFREAAVAVNMSVIEDTDPGTQTDFQALVDDLLAMPRETRPTAVVCWYDDAAQALLAACLRRGISVPEDLAIAGFDGIPSAVPPARRLTTIVAPWEAVARMAISTLIPLLNNPGSSSDTSSGIEEHVFPVKLNIGDTT